MSYKIIAEENAQMSAIMISKLEQLKDMAALMDYSPLKEAVQKSYEEVLTCALFPDRREQCFAEVGEPFRIIHTNGAALDSRLQVFIAGYADGKKIPAIKWLRMKTGWGLKDAKRAVENYEVTPIATIHMDELSEWENMAQQYHVTLRTEPTAQ